MAELHDKLIPDSGDFDEFREDGENVKLICPCNKETIEKYASKRFDKESGREISKPPRARMFIYTYGKKHYEFFRDQYEDVYAIQEVGEWIDTEMIGYATPEEFSKGVLVDENRAMRHAHLPLSKHIEYFPIGNDRMSTKFKEQLYRLTHQHLPKTIPNREEFQSAFQLLRAQATERKTLYNRVALDGETTNWYYDINDTQWQMIRLNDESWQVVPSKPLFFKRPHNLEFSVDTSKTHDVNAIFGEFFKIIPHVTEEYKHVLICILAAMMIPEIPCPVIVVFGPAGSGKSTFVKIANDIIDPTKTKLLAMPADVKELKQQLTQRWCAGYDNISGFKQETSDVLCQRTTGGKDSKRRLYTDEENVVTDLFGRTIMNGVPQFATATDLLRRSFLISLDIIRDATMSGDEVIWQKFQVLAPKIRAVLLDTLVKARRIFPTIKGNVGTLPAFAKWAEAVSQALGAEPNTFFKSYEKNVALQNEEGFGNHILGRLIEEFILTRVSPVTEGGGEFVISMKEFYKWITENATQDEKKQDGFPKAANKLRNKLAELSRPINLRFSLSTNNLHKIDGNYFVFKKDVHIFNNYSFIESKKVMKIDEDSKKEYEKNMKIVEDKKEDSDIIPTKNEGKEEYLQLSSRTNEDRPSLVQEIKRLSIDGLADAEAISNLCGETAIQDAKKNGLIFEPKAGFLQVLE